MLFAGKAHLYCTRGDSECAVFWGSFVCIISALCGHVLVVRSVWWIHSRGGTRLVFLSPSWHTAYILHRLSHIFVTPRRRKKEKRTSRRHTLCNCVNSDCMEILCIKSHTLEDALEMAMRGLVCISWLNATWCTVSSMWCWSCLSRIIDD